MTDNRFFPGTVAMLNSLSLTGNSGEFIVLDQGLTSDQLEFLDQYATVIPVTPEKFGHPFLAKAFALAHMPRPEGAIVIIDSDMIVTHSLTHILSLAEDGKISVFPDHHTRWDRWFGEWEDLFSLPISPRRQRYVNAGFLCFSTHHWPNLLTQWWETCGRIPPETIGRTGPEHPLWNSDQDALNAILMSFIPPSAIAEQPPGAEAYTDAIVRTRVVDRHRLVCEHDGQPTVLLHYTRGPKAWEPRAWRRVRRDAFTLLMPRVLFADDVPMKLTTDAVPIWLRPGRVASVCLRTLDLSHRLSAPLWRIIRRMRRSTKVVR